MAGFNVTASRIEVYGAALNAMLESPNGPIGTRLNEVAERGKTIAQAHCPVGPHTGGPIPGIGFPEPGYLRNSIRVRRELSPDGRGLVWYLGSDVIYARKIEFSRVGGFLRATLNALRSLV
jgi:hypothetical protein